MAVRVTVRTQKPQKRATLLLVNAFGDDKKPGSALLVARRTCAKIAGEMAQEMRDSLYRQRFKMAPLTARYLRWKIKKGLDKRTLLAYKKYVQAIGFVKTPYGGMVGMTKTYRVDKVGKKSRRLEYWKLQRWLEYGTRLKKGKTKTGKQKFGKMGSRMPARPHWRPMIRYWKAHRKDYGLRIKNAVGFDLRQKLKAAARMGV